MLLGLGGRLYGFRTAFYGTALLLMCSGFVVVARYVTMDATLTLFATTMWLSTMLGVQDDRIKLGWLILAGVACGLGLLTKGPIIGVVVLPPILMSGWLQNQRFYTRLSFWLYPALAAVLVSAPWFLSIGIVHPDFLVHFFLKHNLGRFSAAFNHQQPWWFYLPVVFLLMYPACFLLPNFVKHLCGNRDKRRQFGSEYGALILSVGWVLLFFSLSESKLPTYIMPAVSLGCLMLGRYLDLLEEAMRQRTSNSPGSASALHPNAIPRLIATSTLTVLRYPGRGRHFGVGFSRFDNTFVDRDFDRPGSAFVWCVPEDQPEVGLCVWVVGRVPGLWIRDCISEDIAAANDQWRGCHQSRTTIV